MDVDFPRGLVFDLDYIPADFEAQIQQAFHDYTAETNKDYTYQDKLLCRAIKAVMDYGA